MAFFAFGPNMKSKIIALYGAANVGKSATLKLVLAGLEKRPGAVTTRLIDLTDIRAIIAIGDLKIGLETQGDPGGRLAESLDLFVTEGCQFIVCATRTWGATVDVVKARFADTEITWIRKCRADAPEKYDTLNAASAAAILTKIP